VDQGRPAAPAHRRGHRRAANLDGYVSVTPMRADLTAHDALDALRERLE
jgi:5'-nucleotidase